MARRCTQAAIERSRRLARRADLDARNLYYSLFGLDTLGFCLAGVDGPGTCQSASTIASRSRSMLGRWWRRQDLKSRHCCLYARNSDLASKSRPPRSMRLSYVACHLSPPTLFRGVRKGLSPRLTRPCSKRRSLFDCQATLAMALACWWWVGRLFFRRAPKSAAPGEFLRRWRVLQSLTAL